MVRHFTVREFASKHRRSDETVRRWISAGKIYPAPTFDGYQYLIHPSAQKITNYEKLNSTISLNNNCKLLKRIETDGKKQKSQKRTFTT
ncbi:excisionase [Providencia huaxiensis]|uniref:excisionase n=1 Tax=Providencia TaxID=586 RepID=UPI0011838A04|nr:MULTISPECIES: excisionase [Providencia]